MAWERGRDEGASCAGARRGLAESGPRESGPRECGPRECGPRENGPRECGLARVLALLVTLAVVLGGLAGCGDDAGSRRGADGTEGEGEPRELDPGFPVASGDVLAWGDARRGLPWPFEVRGLAAAQGSVWVYVLSREPEAAADAGATDPGEGGEGGAGVARIGSGLFRLNEATWTWERAAPPLPRGTAQQMITGPDDRLYVRAASAVWRHDEGAWTPLPSIPEGRNPVLLAHPDALPDHLAAMIGDAASPALVRIAIDTPPQPDTPDPADADPNGDPRSDPPQPDAPDPADGDPNDDPNGDPRSDPPQPDTPDPADADPAAAWEVVFTDVGTIPDSGPVGAVLGHDGALYVARRWPIRDSQGATGAVFRGTAAGWEDVTWNLRDTRDNGMPIHAPTLEGSTYAATQGQRSPAAIRAAARMSLPELGAGPTQTRMRSPTGQVAATPSCSRNSRTSSSTCWAVRRSASSRSESRFPRWKKCSAARRACSGR